MSLSHAILAGLYEKPSTGYELAKKLEESVLHFWNASHQQIYRELERLQKKGFTLVTDHLQPGKPARKVYSISEKGQIELVHWIHKPLGKQSLRDPLLVKLFIGHISPNDLRKELLNQKEIHLKNLNICKNIEAKYYSDQSSLSIISRFRFYTLKQGIISEEAWLRWCDEVISDLK